MKISAVILTKNEEKNIDRVLKSVDFCDEIIIVDDYSDDRTLSKISNPKSQIQNKSQIPNPKQKIKIFQRHLNGDFAAQRNFAMGRAKSDWILFVDADEEVTRELKEEISHVILSEAKDLVPIKSGRKNASLDSSVSPQNDIVCYKLLRRDFFWGRELKHGEIRKIRQTGFIRLMRKNSGKWIGKVHEEYKVKSQKFKVKSLNNYLNHYPHSTVKKFLEKINFYSTLRARELSDRGESASVWKIIFFPLAKFILNYFIKLGFLDGPAGFTYAFLMSFHSFLVRAKLWQYSKSINLRHSGER